MSILGDFNFNVVARSEGYSIRISFRVPAPGDSPDWSRRLRIVRKRGEWPLAFDDTESYITEDDIYPDKGEFYLDETDLIPGEIYYYSLYTLSNSSIWEHDIYQDRSSAYPYNRWGSSNYIYNSLPRGWRTVDADGTNDLANFLEIFGAILDDGKTDIEQLASLFDIDTIHTDLIYMLDHKIGWPTWLAANGLKKRKETLEAVDLYRLLGRRVAYENFLSEISDWNVTVVEGWKYVMWSNGLYGSTTPDTTNPYLTTRIGWIDDYLKYSNYLDEWPCVNGLRFFLSEVPGVSGELTEEMWSRFQELIEWGKASYVSISIVVVPTREESWAAARTVDNWEDSTYISFEPGVPPPTHTDLGYTTASVDLFESNIASSITNSTFYRTFHKDLSYV